MYGSPMGRVWVLDPYGFIVLSVQRFGSLGCPASEFRPAKGGEGDRTTRRGCRPDADAFGGGMPLKDLGRGFGESICFYSNWF